MKGSSRFFTIRLVAAWYSSNIGVLLLSKYLLNNYGFKYPIFLTMCHMTACSLLSYVAVAWLKLVPLQTIRSRVQFFKTSALSLVFCVCVVFSNGEEKDDTSASPSSSVMRKKETIETMNKTTIPADLFRYAQICSSENHHVTSVHHYTSRSTQIPQISCHQQRWWLGLGRNEMMVRSRVIGGESRAGAGEQQWVRRFPFWDELK